MKLLFKVSTLLFLGLAQAQAINLTLVNPTTLNGSFESGTDNIPSNWQTGLDVTEVYRQIPAVQPMPAPDGNYIMVLGRNNDTNFPGALLNTGYSVKAADTFSLSFQWDDLGGWDANDAFNWRLFTTSDDTLAGALTQIAGGAIVGRTTPAFPTANVLTLGGTVSGANVGRTLWLEFYVPSSTSVVINNEYAGIDNVVLSVETVPEPSVAMLLSLTLAGAGIVRRRKSAA